MPHEPGAPDPDPRAQARIERLLREVEERDDLLAIASHELRNPLHALALQLTLARSTAEVHGQADTVVRIAKAEALLTRYVARFTLLLDLMRVRGESFPIDARNVDLSALLNGIGDALRQEAQFRGVMLQVAVPTTCPAVTDPQLIEQIVDNLLINAFKHASCSRVTLSLQADADGRACIDVADDGRGIDAADQARIFGKFGVAQNSQRGNGTGLGLWIVRRLAAALGATVTLHSAPGGGCRFRLNLPLSASIDL